MDDPRIRSPDTPQSTGNIVTRDRRRGSRAHLAPHLLKGDEMAQIWDDQLVRGMQPRLMVQRDPVPSKPIAETPRRRQGIRKSWDPGIPMAESSFELPSQPLPQMLTVNEVAEILQISPRTVRRMIGDGRLPVVRIGRAVRVHPDTVAALMSGVL
jgi:excisionase family DNA binding protein